MRKFFYPILASVLLLNVCGYLLKYFELPLVFILLGFRFNISILAFLFLLYFLRKKFDYKAILMNGEFKSFWRSSAILLPILILAVTAYFLKYSKFDEPEYLFELGISSVIDFPIYFIWNLPQLMILFLTLNLLSQKVGNKFLLFFVPALFLFELIPLPDSNFNLIRSLEILVGSLLVVVFFIKEKNIYILSFLSFTFFWLIILIYGSNDATVAKVFLATRYDSWQGVLKPASEISLYFPLISILTGFLFLLKKNPRKDSSGK